MSINSEKVKNRRRRIKELVIAYMGGQCFKCSFTGHPASYDAHHVNPSRKEIQVSSGNTIAWEKLKPELDKCLLLCKNCHAEIHATMNSFYFDEANIPDYSTFGVDLEKAKLLTETFCLDCNDKITVLAKRCVACQGKRTSERHGIEWPEMDVILEMITTTNYERAAKQIGCSGNGLRKHVQRFNV